MTREGDSHTRRVNNAALAVMYGRELMNFMGQVSFSVFIEVGIETKGVEVT